MTPKPAIEYYRDIPASLVRTFAKLHGLTLELAYMRLAQGRQMDAYPRTPEPDPVPDIDGTLPF